jgi:hypothetical protein
MLSTIAPRESVRRHAAAQVHRLIVQLVGQALDPVFGKDVPFMILLLNE